MNQQILDMFAKSTFSVSSKKYIYAKVKTKPNLDEHFMVTQDEDEFTVVTEEIKLEQLEVVEKNPNYWRLVSLNLATPFLLGTLATINNACFAEGLSNLVVSTYSKDYLIVKDNQVEQINNVLKQLGFKEKDEK